MQSGESEGGEKPVFEETLVLASRQCAATHCTSHNFFGTPVAHTHPTVPTFLPVISGSFQQLNASYKDRNLAVTMRLCKLLPQP